MFDFIGFIFSIISLIVMAVVEVLIIVIDLAVSCLPVTFLWSNCFWLLHGNC